MVCKFGALLNSTLILELFQSVMIIVGCISLLVFAKYLFIYASLSVITFIFWFDFRVLLF
jgi:hypothetical protein